MATSELHDSLRERYPADDPTPMWMRIAAIRTTLMAKVPQMSYAECQELAEKLFEMATSRV